MTNINTIYIGKWGMGERFRPVSKKMYFMNFQWYYLDLRFLKMVEGFEVLEFSLKVLEILIWRVVEVTWFEMGSETS